MAIFGLYFTKNFLSHMGWPRKQSFLGKEVLDTTILDSTIDQMVDWAAAIGAGRPKLGLSIIAYMFQDRDWNDADAPKIKQFFDSMTKHWEKNAKTGLESPHEIVDHVQFANHGPTVPSKVLLDKEFKNILEQDFLGGLLYGLSNPSSYQAWYKNHLKEFDKKLPMMKESGLKVDKLPSLDENYTESEQIIRNYEQEMEIKFPPVPSKLVSDAKALGIKF